MTIFRQAIFYPLDTFASHSHLRSLTLALTLTTASLPTLARTLPSELCFESIPKELFFSPSERRIFPDDATARAHEFAYVTFQIQILRQKTDSSGYTMFDFFGHGNDRHGDEGAMQGVGYILRASKFNKLPQDTIHIEYTANLYQPTIGLNPGPVYAVHSIWTLDTKYQGSAVTFNDITNTNILSIDQTRPANAYNDFNFSIIKRIPCRDVLPSPQRQPH